MAFTFNNRKDAQIDQNHANIKQKYINYSNLTCLYISLCSDMRYCVFSEFTILILQKILLNLKHSLSRLDVTLIDGAPWRGGVLVTGPDLSLVSGLYKFAAVYAKFQSHRPISISSTISVLHTVLQSGIAFVSKKSNSIGNLIK